MVSQRFALIKDWIRSLNYSKIVTGFIIVLVTKITCMKSEARLHGELGLSYLKCRRNKHILPMMFALKSRRPDLLDSRDKKIVLRSNSNIRFKEDKSNYEVCTKSPYVRGCTLWNKLPAHIQSVITRKEFDILLTPEILAGL